MTARASRSGVKRTRATARERLLSMFDGMTYADVRRVLDDERWPQRLRRLLRAHERELAERAMHEFDVRFDGRPFISGAKLKAAVRAAILGPPSAGQRKRGMR